MPPVTSILVPTDFSPASKRALRYACNLAKACSASLDVIHVLENPFTRAAFSEMYGPLQGDVLEELERRTRAELQAQLTLEERAKYSAVFILRAGVPAHEILDYLNEQRAIDLVVMATAGRGGIGRLMMGSVADKIVRAAPCPVLTVHPKEDAETNSTDRAA
jgi:universal stress protein A